MFSRYSTVFFGRNSTTMPTTSSTTLATSGTASATRPSDVRPRDPLKKRWSNIMSGDPAGSTRRVHRLAPVGPQATTVGRRIRGGRLEIADSRFQIPDILNLES
jgi:hypothetical protein